MPGRPGRDAASTSPRAGGPTGLERKSGGAALLTVVRTAAGSISFKALREALAKDAYIDPCRLKMMRALGEGAFANIRHAELRPPAAADVPGTPRRGGGSWGFKNNTDASSGGKAADCREVAVKTLRQELLQDPEQVQLFVKEVSLLRNLRHRHIVEFVGCSWSQRNTLDDSARGIPQELFYVQEYCAGGSLGDLVRRQMIRPFNRLYSDADALRWCLHIALALDYLHEARPVVIHRDLKLENIMLSSADVALADAKLADFGLARLSVDRKYMDRITRLLSRCKAPEKLGASLDGSGSVGLDGDEDEADDDGLCAAGGFMPEQAASFYLGADELTSQTGSFGTMAPEVLRGTQYSAKVDIFSLGMCMHSLFARTVPAFQIMLSGNASHLEIYAAKVADGFRPPLPPGLPASVAGAIQACWKGDPDLRPTAGALVDILQAIWDSGELGLQTVERCPVAHGCCSIM